MANRLARESSPYLRQHAHNPVDWYPWGDDAFERARREDKPVLLSVGYSSCHWCHVMAHESFEDEDTARLMNEGFINIKVDREERPDVDAIYMNAVQAMTGSGGWPMTMVLTPDGEPFFGGTYFPPDDRFGRPSFRRVLTALSQAWRDRRDEVTVSASQMRSYLEGLERAAVAAGELDPAIPATALEGLAGSFDETHGGFGGAPKFPPHSTLRFLLARPEERSREMAHATLRAMAKGGLFDQLGGGFARYSVDEKWLVPHFEKMLYDNGQLLSRYSEAYRYTADPLYARVVELTAGWLERELRHPDGGFYSALDADSEGEEGRFYVWDEREFHEVLGEEAEGAKAWFGVSEAGNFEWRNVLTLPADEGAVARSLSMSPDELEERAEEWRRKLLEAREERVRPGLDDKVITSWNGLVIGGLADAGKILHRQEFIDLARGAASFVRQRLWSDGRLRHVWAGGSARIEGLLEDYAFLGQGLLSLYEATFEQEWLDWAFELVTVIEERFASADGPFYSTAKDGERLIVRPRSLSDAAVPSDNAVAAELFVHAGRLLADERLEARAQRAVSGLAELATQHPAGMGSVLCAIEFLLQPPREIAVVGDLESADTQALLRIVQQQPLPYSVTAHSPGPDHPLAGRLPFLRQRDRLGGKAAAYLCEAGSCRLPVAEPGDLARQLAGQAGSPAGSAERA